jgi:hypothetical protein
MLLPISVTPEEVTPEDFDIESGLRRRKGKGRVMEEEDGDVRPSESARADGLQVGLMK